MNRIKQQREFLFFLQSFLPNGRDNIKQLFIKSLYLISALGILLSGIFFGNYFSDMNSEKELLTFYRNIKYSEDIDGFEELQKENPDLSAWIKLDGINLDHPVFQGENNSFYLNHNANKEKSSYGSIYLDSKNKITKQETDRNLLIYGKSNRDGSGFGGLKKLRNLNFYKQHSIIKFTTENEESTYRIYAVFVLNASKSDDSGYIYNIRRNSFLNKTDFDLWVGEAKSRSVINTNVNVNLDDSILTLITECDDFPNSRLVVMAKKLSKEENATPNNANATANHYPLYPQRWYDERGIKNNTKREEY